MKTERRTLNFELPTPKADRPTKGPRDKGTKGPRDHGEGGARKADEAGLLNAKTQRWRRFAKGEGAKGPMGRYSAAGVRKLRLEAAATAEAAGDREGNERKLELETI